MNKYAFEAIKVLLGISLLFGISVAVFAGWEFIKKDSLSEPTERQIRKIVNESIMCFEMPEEKIEPSEIQEQLQDNQEYYVYYVSYFYNGTQGGAEVPMTRQITCWADLYTAKDSVQTRLGEIIKDMKSFVVIQYTLLRYHPAQ